MVLCVVLVFSTAAIAHASDADPPDLGRAASYSVLASSSISNTGQSNVDADLGTFPGTSISGFPPGIVSGSQHSGDDNAAGAQDDLQSAYDTTTSRPSSASISGDIGGKTFGAGTYRADAALTIGSTIFFDAQGDGRSIFVVQVGAALSVAAGVHIALEGGAQASRVFWQVTGAVSLGASVHFVGTILGDAAITFGAGTSLIGRALTLSGAISLSSNSIEPQSPIDLGAAANYSALAGSSVLNTGPTVLSGDIGASPGSVVTGFPPGITSGVIHRNDAGAALAQSNLAAAIVDADARISTGVISGDLSGKTLRSGVYSSSATIRLQTDLILDGKNNPNGIFIFQIDGRLSTSVGSRIILINGAQPSNVFWRVSGETNLGGGSYFRGTILGSADIIVGANTNLIGRTLTRSGTVSLHTSPLSSSIPVALGLGSTFSVLAGASVAGGGVSSLQGDLGVSPATAISGFPPGQVGGTQHPGDAVAAQAQEDVNAAYADAASRVATSMLNGDIGGTTLTPGVYVSAAALSIGSLLTFDGLNNPNAIFIIQVQAALNTAASTSLKLTNGASASNIFWQITGAASLGADSSFAGTILGFAAVSVGSNVSFVGRILALNGAVTLDSDTITTPPMGVWYLTATITSAALSAVTINGTTTQIASDRTIEWIVTDNRETLAAWTLSVSATALTSAAGSVENTVRTLPVGKLSIDPGPVTARDRPGSVEGITEKQVIFSGATQPIVWSAGRNPGSYTFNPTFHLSIPPNVFRSNYSGAVGSSPINSYISTITYTID